jgi:hypothetical protein
VAKELGLNTRTNHKGRLYPTDGPTSTKQVAIDSQKSSKLDIGSLDRKPDFFGSAGPAGGIK